MDKDSAVELVDHYMRQAAFVDVIDGDTIRCRVDCGYETFRLVRLRVNGFDAAEMSDKTGRGRHARDVCRDVMLAAKTIWVKTSRKEMHTDEEKRTFERYVGDIWVDGQWLPDVLKSKLQLGGDNKWGETKGTGGQ